MAFKVLKIHYIMQKKKYIWIKIFVLDEVDSIPTQRPAKRLCSIENVPMSPKISLDRPIGLSQPMPQVHEKDVQLFQENNKDRDTICFSQPTHFDDLIISTQFQFTQSHVNKNNFQKLVSRMTRFFVKTSFDKTLQILCKKLEDNGYTWNRNSTGIVSFFLLNYWAY